MTDIKPEGLSVDEFADEIKSVNQKGGTPADERDMSRLGKTQELRVSICPSTPDQCDMILNLDEAQLQVYRHSRVHHDSAIDLGVYSVGQLVRPIQWRHGGVDLVHNRCMALYV